MKFQRPEHFTRQTAGIVGSTFNIQMTDKLFETLYSKLYKYKEEAVCRELMCNYLDSHQMRDRQMRVVMASYVTSCLAVSTPPNLNPWLDYGRRGEVHLPSEMEPYLEVKDFGIGLPIEKIIGEPLPAREGEFLLAGNRVVGGLQTDAEGNVTEYQLSENDEVIGHPGMLDGKLVFRDPYNNEIIRGPGLYTTLFHSTKETDNNQIGAFGLGSKSPFSVSDSFTVESRWNGQVHNFLMFLDANRIPRVDVLTKDFDTRDPKPIPTEEKNGLTIRVPIKTSRYHIFNQALAKLCRVFLPHELPIIDSDAPCVINPITRDNQVGNTYVQPKINIGRHYAVMGGVAYPIDIQVLSEGLRDVLARMPETYTMFELGSLNVPPSREELEYGEISVQEIERELAAVRDNFISGLIERVQLARERGVLHGIMAWKDIENVYGEGMGNIVRQSLPADPRFSDKYEHIRLPRMAVEKIEGEYTEEVYLHPFTMMSYYGNQREDANKILSGEVSRATFVVLDKNTAFLQKIKHLEANNYGSTIYVITPKDRMGAGISINFDTKGKQFLGGFKDPEKVIAYRNEWFGDKKEINYAAFGDKFLEHFDGLIPNVFLMSELTYEKLVVDPYPGILAYHSAPSWNSGISSKNMRGEEVINLTEHGKLAFFKISGWNMAHEYKGKSLDWKGIEEMSTVLDVVAGRSADRNTVTLARRLGLAHSTFYMGRRKATKFMEDNSSYFVDINDVMAQLGEELSKYQDVLQHILDNKEYNERRNQWGFARHALWVAQELGDAELINNAKKYIENIRPSWERVQRNRKTEYSRLNNKLQTPTPQGGLMSPGVAYGVYTAVRKSIWSDILGFKLDYADSNLRRRSYLAVKFGLEKDLPTVFDKIGQTGKKPKVKIRTALEQNRLLKLLSTFKPQYLRYGESVEDYRRRILRDLAS